MSTSAIVFAYHNVGVRCLRALLDAGVDVRLVITHEDNPAETIWFDSVATVAAESGIECIAPSDPNTPELLARCAALAPDFLFSFYYRHMLKAPLLAVPGRGAFNLHGSLLPKYRGRVPVNWAVLHGERETGATLHVMNEKPDNGAIVDQCAVPILGDDTAREVFDKVTVAAEIVIARAVPRLIDGTARLRPQDLAQGAYFGGRKAEDGRVPAGATAQQIHNLVRAVAPPYPGAWFDAGGHRITLLRTQRFAGATLVAPASCFRLEAVDRQLLLTAADGTRLRVLEAALDGEPLDAARLRTAFGNTALCPDL
ncbi:MAG: hypothetical protein RLZZ598_675 [Pseudomonadota bacterium]|jgi:methionyl-tRNA formyltransferase